MELLTILKAIEEGAALLGSIRKQIAEAKEVLSSDDQAQIDAALAKLQFENDALHAKVQDDLRG